MLTKIINDYTNLAINTYHVNPWIFIGLIILSLPFFYGSFFVITRELARKVKTKKWDTRTLTLAVLVNFISYIMPYVYVIIWGRNLPFIFLLFIVLVMVVTIYSFIGKTVKPIKKVNK